MRKLIIITVILFCLFRAYTAVFWPKHIFSPAPACTSHPFLSENWEDDVLDPSYQKKISSFLQNYQPNDFRYFRETFIKEKGDTNIILNLRNEQHCFHALFHIDHFKQLDKMVSANGQSWPKELYDVEWRIENKQGQPILLFTKMAEVID